MKSEITRHNFGRPGCFSTIVGGKVTGIKRNRGTWAKNAARNTAVVYSQSRVSQQEENKVELSSSSTVVADRVHPLSDLALHEPGELIRLPKPWNNNRQEPINQLNRPPFFICGNSLANRFIPSSCCGVGSSNDG